MILVFPSGGVSEFRKVIHQEIQDVYEFPCKFLEIQDFFFQDLILQFNLSEFLLSILRILLV